jgi:hypothetical protein
MDGQPASTIRLDLTVEQKQIVKAVTNRDAEALELSVQELEQRIAPSSLSFGDITVMKPTDVGSANLF